MSEKPVYVVSDIHLGGVPERTERAFRRFLREAAPSAAEILINGDLFDFWFEYRTVIHARHYRVLAALAELRESGVTIRFVGGNHDAWGGSFLRDEVGIELLPDRAELLLADLRTLVVHGDGLGRGDLGYRVLKKVLRHPLSAKAFRMLHPDLGSGLARLVSTTESKHGTPELANIERAAALRAWAGEQLRTRPDLDLVVAGHTHTPLLEEVSPGRYYVNTGDWINHFSFLVLSPGEAPELRYWET
jgi:UDP-2,3-diacylglucosamine hydrolase